MLYSQTVALKPAEWASQAENIKTSTYHKYFLTAPAFCYCFYMLRQSLTSSLFKSNEKMLNDGIQIIGHHSKLRGSAASRIDLYHPGLLPTEHMLQLLIDLIGLLFVFDLL